MIKNRLLIESGIVLALITFVMSMSVINYKSKQEAQKTKIKIESER